MHWHTEVMILSGICGLSGIGIFVSRSLVFRDSFSIFRGIHIVSVRSILQPCAEESEVELLLKIGIV